jgi:uncharacterized protein YcaQ
MLDVLWTQGKVMVAGRRGLEKLWDLSDRILPEWTPREILTDRKVTSRASQRSLRALGVATARHIENHFTMNRYPGLTTMLAELEREGRIERVRVAGDGLEWPGHWFVHADDLPLLERLERGEWEPRTTLLSPFDNLICDRNRAELMFGIRFRTEIYVPKAKRQYGYYLLPILHGDEIVGRIDAALDRKAARLVLKAVHAEAGAPKDRNTSKAVSDAIEDLAAFLDVRDVAFEGEGPNAFSSRALPRRTRP